MSGEEIVLPSLVSFINAGSQAVQSQRDQVHAWHMMQMQHKFQKEMAEYAYQQDLAQWHRQNEYNLPANQMARFKAGGLNPHLIYGQGTPGNAQSSIQYRPPQLDVNIPPAQGVMTTLLPQLMQVGSWLQDMRKSQVDIDNAALQGTRVQQMIDYLSESNPLALQKLRNANALFPFQSDIMNLQREKVQIGMEDMMADFRVKYGDAHYAKVFGKRPETRIGGLSSLKLLQQEAATRLSQARASWSDLNITDPQGLMMLVLQGIMGMAGTQLRLSTQKRPTGKITSSESIKRVGRTRTTTTTRPTYGP